MAIYLNGTELADDVYANSDGNAVDTAPNESLGPEGTVQSYWDGPRETALYPYGPSASRIAKQPVWLLLAPYWRILAGQDKGAQVKRDS
jgi:hypothetical protein